MYRKHIWKWKKKRKILIGRKIHQGVGFNGVGDVGIICIFRNLEGIRKLKLIEKR
jgi:hypothetical protein